MYTAKSRGKAHHKVFDPDMEAEAHERLLLEGGLRRALERGEFRLHYEPTVVLETGEVIGFEALIRWEHPERGLIRPAEFVPLAEENGLIVPMGKWVIEEVCRQAREWHKERPMGPPIVVSVNLSARQFKHPLLVQEISEALQRSGLDPSALTLEITETVMMESGEGLIRRLEELKSLGVMLAIDDFGTGYSSLSYLARFPLDYLKVDRSFIAGLDKSERNVVLVSAVINLAKTLGLRVVAEGVETESQLLILRSLDCGLGQGYLFARPRPADAISPSLLRAGPPNGRAP
jgi:EAL domain-containing protein (putative c-di-GMP-specific phosphodiesterase class I)